MLSLSKFGLTINEATTNIRRTLNAKRNAGYPINNHRFLINLGTTDIVNGISFHNLIQQYVELIKTCNEFEILPTILTLMPFTGEHNSIELNWIIREFNTFLMDTFKNVIDLWKILFSKGFLEVMNEFLNY